MITKEMSITGIIEQYPQSVAVFLNHGMHCFGCAAARFENIERGAQAHGLDVNRLLNDLNKAIS